MANKIKIDLRNIANWATASNYTISIEEGFVKEVDGNKSLSPSQDNVYVMTSFSSPPAEFQAVSPNYNATGIRYPLVSIRYPDRGIVFNTTGTSKYYINSSTQSTSILSTSSRVSIDNNTITFNLLGILNSSTQYHITSDQGVVQDLFKFNSVPVNNDSYVKFTTGNWVTPLPSHTFSVNTASFGCSVGVNEDFIAIGSEDESIGSAKGVVRVYSKNTRNLLYTFTATNTAITGTSSYFFGRSIGLNSRNTLSNFTILIGSPNRTTGLSAPYNTGYVHQFNLNNGSLVRSISADYATMYPWASTFGYRIVVDGNVSFISSQNISNNGGAAIYGLDGQGPIAAFNQTVPNDSVSYPYMQPVAYYNGPYQLNFDRTVVLGLPFTYTSPLRPLAIAAFDNKIVVGFPRENTSVIGKIIVYDTVNLTTLAEIFDPHPSLTLNFGSWVGISSDFIVVNSRLTADEKGSRSGRIYVYSASTYQLRYIIDNPELYENPSTTNDNFGTYIAIHKKTIILGSPAQRKVFVYDLD